MRQLNWPFILSRLVAFKMWLPLGIIGVPCLIILSKKITVNTEKGIEQIQMKNYEKTCTELDGGHVTQT